MITRIVALILGSVFPCGNAMPLALMKTEISRVAGAVISPILNPSNDSAALKKPAEDGKFYEGDMVLSPGTSSVLHKLIIPFLMNFSNSTPEEHLKLCRMI